MYRESRRRAWPQACAATASTADETGLRVVAQVKAVVLREFGGPEVLNIEEVPTPSPGSGEVLVKVRAVSVNRVYDLHARQGRYRRETIRLPAILGVDPSGEVVGVGKDVVKFREGERVAVSSRIPCDECSSCQSGDPGGCPEQRTLGLDRWGGYAEYVTVPEAAVYAIEPNLSFSDATVVARHFPAAYNLLLNQAGLKVGEWVLVMGAGGALAGCAVQVATLEGARVIAAAGAPERVEIGRSFGAEYGVDYSSGNLTSEVGEITGGRGVDVVLDSIGSPDLWPDAFNSLARGGRLVSVGGHGGGVVPLDIYQLYLRRLRVIGGGGATAAQIKRALIDASKGKIRPIPYRVMPLQEAARAHSLLEMDRSVGKIVLDPAMPSQSEPCDLDRDKGDRRECRPSIF